jgi:hypothetical protein
LLTLKIIKMRTKLFMLGAVGLLAVGVGIHHSGHCPLMQAKAALTKHSVTAPAKDAANVASAQQGTDAVATDAATR